MTETLVLEEEDLREALDPLSPVATSSWRHGHEDTYVFERDGKMWMVTIQVHHSEGWQLYGKITCRRAKAVPTTITKWVPYEESPPIGGSTSGASDK